MSETIPVSEFVRREWIASENLLSDKINYACGTNPISGWINTDLFDGSLLWHYKDTGIPVEIANDVFNINLLQRHPFPNDAFNYAFCEDFIEHIDQKSAILFLSEILRTLAPGGIFRISTPSLDGVLAAHFLEADLDRVIEQTPFAFDMWGHIHFFCHASLKKIALALGFVEYRECAFGQSEHLTLRGLETRSEQMQLNLYAEFQQPAQLKSVPTASD